MQAFGVADREHCSWFIHRVFKQTVELYTCLPNEYVQQTTHDIG